MTFRQDSYRNPKGIRKDSDRTPGPPESGYGKGLVVGQQQRRKEALDWAAKALPREHPPFVVAAYQAIRCGGGRPSAESVKARLVEQGRDTASLERLA